MIRHIWPLLIGFSVWAIAFVVIYSAQALGCVWNWHPAWHRGALIAMTVLTMACLWALLALQLARIKTERSLIEQAGVVLTATTLPISLVVFAPTAFLSICN